MAANAPVVTADLWRVPPRAVPAALLAVAGDRGRIRALPGARFAKVLGTARSFSGRDPDLTRWLLVASWQDADAAAAYRRGAVARRWRERSVEGWHATLRPLLARGQWSGREPFGAPADRPEDTGPVVAITRARLVPRRALTFWRAVPAPAGDLLDQPGLLLSVAMGEAPLGVQGTFSVWSSAAQLRRYAYGRQAHREVVRRTREVGWYAEALFARFALVGASGTVDGHPVGAAPGAEQAA